MNKKVSTLLTAGLFLSGSLFSSAFAEKLIKGDLVKELNTNEAYIFSNGEMAYGFTEYSQTNKIVTDNGLAFDASGNAETGDIDVKAYLWKVTAKTVDSQNKNYVYELTNQLTGLKLQFNQATGELEVNYSNDDAHKATSGIVFENGGAYFANLFADGSAYEYPATSYVAADTQTPAAKSYLVLTTDGLDVQTEAELTAAGASAENFGFYVAKNIPATSEELNDLYNSVGFNFTLGTGNEGVENIFDGEAVKAIYVASDIKVDTDRTFPAGTYFAVSTPAGDYTKLTSDAARRDYLMDCEFIALSATDHMSYSADELKTGKGYMLTTVSGRDLNKYTKTGDDADASKMSNGETISVWNACFDVFRKPGTKIYGLTIDKARVSVSGSQVDVTGLQLDVYSVYGGAGYLATEKSNAVNFIFSFEESNVVKATELLKENGAAIYNIKFKTTGSDQTENNKYLFASAYNNTLYAKGVVLTNENNPEFQFTITNVDTNNNITFTNRANHNAKFTAQLFDEGNGVYSLALVQDERDYAATILNVDNEGNVTDKKSDGTTTNTAKLHRNKIVLETPESTDMFNGTWTVASNEKVTISFARDNDPTSNKIYPTVEENGSAYSLTGKQTAEISEASQWQLVRTSNTPNYYTQTYAFKVVNGETETVKYMSLGDTIAYYTYNIQLVADGMAQDQYLRYNSSNDTYDLQGKTAFIIKDNIDGSVSIVAKDYDADKFLSILYYKRGNKNDLEYFLDKSMQAYDLSQTSNATDIKTYLLSEAPEVSWPATEGHISWQGELGNYISMNENRDGIVVNDSEEVYYLNVTDKKEVVPSFYISRGTGADDRMFLFNPQDSIDYYVGEGKYDKTYEWIQGKKKVIFKAAQLNETSDTLTTNIKGEVAKLAMKSDNKGTQGGLNRFKFQIIEAADADAEGLYYIRQAKAGIHKGTTIENESNLENYLSSWNETLSWSNKTNAMLFHIEGAAAPTANEGVYATEVKIIATDGAINVKNAAGKNVVVSTILGQIVANEVLTSDNATISVPAGIVIVSVDGEEAVKVNVK